MTIYSKDNTLKFIGDKWSSEILENNLDIMVRKNIQSIILDFSNFDSYVDESTIKRIESIASRKGIHVERIIEK